MKAKHLFVGLIIALTCACSIKPITFSDPVSSTDLFFTECIKQAKKRKKLDANAVLSGQMDVYRVRYREQQVETDGVLEWQMISENDPRFNHDEAGLTSGQNIYIYRLHAPNIDEDVFVYYSKSVDADQKCTGVGHAYLGRLDSFNRVPTIFFYEELSFVYNKKTGSYLEPDRKSKKRDSTEMYIMRFTLAGNVNRGDAAMQIDKITLTRMNKTGGDNPVVYPIDPILGERALRMTRQ